MAALCFSLRDVKERTLRQELRTTHESITTGWLNNDTDLCSVAAAFPGSSFATLVDNAVALVSAARACGGALMCAAGRLSALSLIGGGRGRVTRGTCVVVRCDVCTLVAGCERSSGLVHVSGGNAQTGEKPDIAGAARCTDVARRTGSDEQRRVRAAIGERPQTSRAIGQARRRGERPSARRLRARTLSGAGLERTLPALP